MRPEKKHRSARRGAGASDRFQLVETACPFLPIAGDDEQRIVDADRETDHRDDVGDEEREIEGHADQSGDPERDRDRHHREDDRDQRGDDRPEHEHQHHEGDRQTDRLALLEPLLGEPDEVVLESDRAGHESFETFWCFDVLHGVDQQLGMLAELGVLDARQGHRHQRRSAGLGDRTLVREVAPDVADGVRSEGRDRRLQLPHIGSVLGAGYLRPGRHHDELRVLRRATQTFLQHRGGPLGLGLVREIGVGREGIAEVQR